MNSFYVYAYIDLEQERKFDIKTSVGDVLFEREAIYIGVDNDIIHHNMEMIEDPKLKKILTSNFVKKIKILNTLSSHKAYELCAEVIFKIGRKDTGRGPLLNTDGGVKLLTDPHIEVTRYNLEFNRFILTIEALNNASKIIIGARFLEDVAFNLKISMPTLRSYREKYKMLETTQGWIQKI